MYLSPSFLLFYHPPFFFSLTLCTQFSLFALHSFCFFVLFVCSLLLYFSFSHSFSFSFSFVSIVLSLSFTFSFSCFSCHICLLSLLLLLFVHPLSFCCSFHSCSFTPSLSFFCSVFYSFYLPFQSIPHQSFVFCFILFKFIFC